MRPSPSATPAPAASARHGLGAWLAAAFSLLSVLVTAVLVAVTVYTASGQVRSSIGSNLAELANQTTSRLDRSMYERFREVRLMAERLSRVPELTEVRAQLDSLQKTYPNYAWLGMVDPSGKVLASSGGLLTGADVSKREWFRNALLGRNMGDVHEAVLLAKLLVNPTGDPLRFVDIAFPVLEPDGQPRGVLGVHLSWQWAKEVEKAIFLPVGRNRTVEPLIVSSSGVVLLGPPDVNGRDLDLPSLRAAGQGAGYLTETWPDGKEYLVGYSADHGYRDYPGLGWRVLVRQELDEAYEPVRQLQARIIGGGLLVALLFTLLGWAAARQITRPLIGLAAAARRIEAGEAVEVQVRRPYREVEQLGQAFNSLVGNLRQKEADLRELNATLERRVEDRTARLREAFDRVRDNEQRIQSIIESAPDPFVGMDFAGRITDWNPRAEQLFGWRREEVLGQPLQEVLIPPRFRPTTGTALEHFVTTREASFINQPIERLVVDRDGREIPVEVRIGLIDTGKLKLLSAFVHDISQRKEIERLKNEFISTVSHELRTPLTAIYGSLSLLGSGVAGALPPQAQQLVEISNQSCERLIRLINDVLDVEKIESGQLQVELGPHSLRDLVERSVRDTQAYADPLGVRLRLVTDTDAQVDVDGDRIIQVLVNLLSNAAKFSPRDGVVDVGIAVQGDVARVSVVDHGPGVPEGFRARIFDRFAQADASDRRQKGGTGLGLNICRSIIRAHGGRIDFDSRPGWTEFFFELPLRASEDSPP